MCGIAGVIDLHGTHSADALRDMALRMRERLVHRGPDDAGLWQSTDGRVCLVHRRLSIIDPSPAGVQPMVSHNGETVLTFNGEIYNFSEFEGRVRSRGHELRSRADSEVLLYLLADSTDPSETLAELRGMFALASWSTKTRTLLLARDPFGKKPLYYARRRDVFAFASELTALHEVPGVCDDIDPLAVQEYLLLQYVNAPRSIYRGVSKLPPGHLLSIPFPSTHTPRPRAYYVFHPAEPTDQKPSIEAAAEELRGVVRQAVERRLVSDVPLGAFLSGGVDSSLIVAMMARELGQTVDTFSIGFAGAADSEHTAAAQIAKHLGTRHHEHIVEASALDSMSEVVAALDEPNGDSSCLPTWLLSRFAREHVTVALSGDGGDEMFGGYGRYGRTIEQQAKTLPGAVTAAVVSTALRRPWRIHQSWPPPFDPTEYLPRVQMLSESRVESLVGPLAGEVVGLLGGWKDQLRDERRPLLHRMRTVDANSYLPGAVLAKVDRMSMQFALEVRCPLLDLDVARWSARLPHGLGHAAHADPSRRSKAVLKHLTSRYLPQELVYQPKRGFGLPGRAWSREHMIKMCHERLLAPNAQLTRFVRSDGLEQFVADMALPDLFSPYKVWGMLVLEGWLRRESERESGRARAS